MKQETKKPLYQQLNEARTQGKVNATTKTYLGFYELQFKNGETLCTVPKVNVNERYIANAEYTALAVNNLHHLAEALESVIEDLKDWYQYNVYQIESFTGNEADMQRSIANEINGRLQKAKEALNRIS